MKEKELIAFHKELQIDIDSDSLASIILEMWKNESQKVKARYSAELRKQTRIVAAKALEGKTSPGKFVQEFQSLSSSVSTGVETVDNCKTTSHGATVSSPPSAHPYTGSGSATILNPATYSAVNNPVPVQPFHPSVYPVPHTHHQNQIPQPFQYHGQQLQFFNPYVASTTYVHYPMHPIPWDIQEGFLFTRLALLARCQSQLWHRPIRPALKCSLEPIRKVNQV
ncbi:hypothetical protein BJ742DRAFT_788438 [Cladochytrium replicatum]|nr:hypothetical protein BJ742DRAFT_788438 [Cladochytrium replicatum]